MRRGTTSGIKIESENDRWLLAKMTGPGLGHVLQAEDVRPEDQPEERPQDDPLEKK
jgi:hypothetical protein